MLHTKTGVCPLCLRKSGLTFHHLIPRKLHRRDHFKKHYSKQELNKGINICRKCHSGIHNFYDEMTLAKELNSLALIQSDAALSRHFKWVGKQRIKSE